MASRPSRQLGWWRRSVGGALSALLYVVLLCAAFGTVLLVGD